MKLLKFEVNAFKKISPESPIVIDFSQSRFVRLQGDNMMGKTSLLEALLVACGHLSKENKDFVNIDSGKLDLGLTFKGNDNREYFVRVTKSQFKLTYEGEALEEPITKLKKLLGIPGVSPMEIKFAPLRDIIKWLAAYTKRGADEYEKEYRRLKEGLRVARNGRADCNRQYKALKQVLAEEPMYLNWEASEKKYARKPDLKALSAALDDAGKRADNLLKAETKLKQLKDREAQLLAELAEVQGAIKTGESYVEKNKAAKGEYDRIRAEYDNAAQYAAEHQKWAEIKRKKAEMEEYETLSQRADAGVQDVEAKIRELQAEIIPDVRGIELVLEDEMKDGKVVRPEGLYKGNISSAQMSESEWFSVVMAILKKNKCPILVIDNLTSLGTAAIKVIEQFHKEGAYIFAAEMHRDKKRT